MIQNLKPALLRPGVLKEGALYAYPIIYRSRTRCWEAERDRRQDCLAVQNFQPNRKLQIQEQVCRGCGMRAYASLVVAQVGRRIGEHQLRQLRNLAERANRYLSRLFKVEHYYNRMRDMDVTISRMGTVMQSMADPVILTDNQHRVIIQNKAAERFFRVPEGVSEGGRRAVELNNLLFSAALSSMVVSASDASRDLTLVDVMEGSGPDKDKTPQEHTARQSQQMMLHIVSGQPPKKNPDAYAQHANQNNKRSLNHPALSVPALLFGEMFSEEREPGLQIQLLVEP